MSRIAAQLYTLRDHTKIKADFANTLKRVSEIGYRWVQLSAVGCMNGENPEVTAKDARALLDEIGIGAPLTHRGWDEISERTEECIEFHQTIGAELVAIGSIPGNYRADGLDGYKRFAEDCQPAIAKLKAAGLLFAYHNHAFEFERMGPEGKTPFQVMAETGGPDFLFEIDTYWVVHAGVDLQQLIGDLSGRIPMIHVKDKNPSGNEVRMAPVGEGNLNWDAYLSAAQSAGTELFAVEQDDCYDRDPFDCLASSYRYLQGRL